MGICSETEHAGHHDEELIWLVQFHADDTRLRHVELAGGAGLFDQFREAAADDDVHVVEPPHHFFPQLRIGRYPLAVIDRRVLAAGDEPGAVNACEFEHKGGSLDKAVTGAALGPGHVAARGDIPIAAAVDGDRGLDALAAGFVLDDDAVDAVALANRVDDLRVQHEADAGLADELHGENFPPMRIDADSRGALGIKLMVAGGAEGLEPLAEFQRESLDDQPVVAVVKAEPGERGGDAAEKSGALDEERLRAIAGGGERGGKAGGA